MIICGRRYYHDQELSNPPLFSRLLTAVVINASFRQVRLNNTGETIFSGFGGKACNLGVEVVKRLRANALPEFVLHLSNF